MDIYVGFSRPKKWKPFAKLIMVLYSIPYDHVYIKFHSNSYDRDIIYQASKNFINFMGNIVFNSENEIIKEFKVEISDDSYKGLMQFAIDNAGKPYSLKEALGLGIVRICSLFGKKIQNPFKEGTSEYVCSVLAGYILKDYCNVELGEDFENIDPKYLYDLLSKVIKE
jgi:hypothetical protein